MRPQTQTVVSTSCDAIYPPRVSTSLSLREVHIKKTWFSARSLCRPLIGCFWADALGSGKCSSDSTVLLRLVHCRLLLILLVFFVLLLFLYYYYSFSYSTATSTSYLISTSFSLLASCLLFRFLLLCLFNFNYYNYFYCSSPSPSPFLSCQC